MRIWLHLKWWRKWPWGPRWSMCTYVMSTHSRLEKALDIMLWEQVSRPGIPPYRLTLYKYLQHNTQLMETSTMWKIYNIRVDSRLTSSTLMIERVWRNRFPLSYYSWRIRMTNAEYQTAFRHLRQHTEYLSPQRYHFLEETQMRLLITKRGTF